MFLALFTKDQQEIADLGIAGVFDGTRQKPDDQEETI